MLHLQSLKNTNSLSLPSITLRLHFPCAPALLHLFLNVLSPALHLSITLSFLFSLSVCMDLFLRISQALSLTIPYIPELRVKSLAVSKISMLLNQERTDENTKDHERSTGNYCPHTFVCENKKRE